MKDFKDCTVCQGTGKLEHEGVTLAKCEVSPEIIKCYSCGDYNNRGTGHVMVECCGVCNELWFVGICNMCKGTGIVQIDGVSNVQMIKDACESNGGYFCGYNKNKSY